MTSSAHAIAIAAISALLACSPRDSGVHDPQSSTAICEQAASKTADDTWLDAGPFPRTKFKTAVGCADCVVMNIARLHLPETGIDAASAKMRMADGTYRVVTLDAYDKVVDERTLISNERATRAMKYGKYSPELKSWLSTATPAEAIWVAIWTSVPVTDVRRGDLVKDAPAAAAFRAKVDADVAAQLGPVRTWLKARAPTAELGDSSGPMIRVKLPAPLIPDLAKLPQVASLSTDGYPGKPASAPWSSYSQWGPTIDLPNSQLFNVGNGARVCVKEQYRPDITTGLCIASTAYPTGSTSNHARLSVGVICRTDSPTLSVDRFANVYVGNWTGYSGAGGIDQWCRDQGAATLNYGHYLSTAPGGLTATDRAHDWLAKNSPYIMVAATAGYVDYTWETVGNRGFNGLIVGGVDDYNTADRSDNVADLSVAWKNPSTYYGDYELPHVVAPSNGVLLGTTEFAGGVTAATAMVSGIATAIEGAAPSLSNWPEGKRAIVLATATGATNEAVLTKLPAPSDRRTGAGVVNASQAIMLAQPQFATAPGGTKEWGYYADTLIFSSDFSTDDYWLSKFKTRASRAGRLRVAIAWDATANCTGAGGSCSSDVPDADLDLHLFKKTGDSSWSVTTIPDCYSTAYDSTWEICDIAVDANDEYMIAVRKYATNAASTYLGVAWFHYQQPSGAPCAANSECATGACTTSGRCACWSDADCPDRFCNSSGACVNKSSCGGVGQACCDVAAGPACNPGAQCSAGTCTTCSTCAAETVRIVPRKTSFKQSEPLAFRVYLPNNTTSSCKLSAGSLGVLTIESMTRGGTPVAPSMNSGSFIDGFFSARGGLLTSTSAKSWRQFTWLSERLPWRTPAHSLVTATSNGFSGADEAHFDISAVGSYSMKVRYMFTPPVPSDLCPIDSQLVTVNFDVVGG